MTGQNVGLTHISPSPAPSASWCTLVLPFGSSRHNVPPPPGNSESVFLNGSWFVALLHLKFSRPRWPEFSSVFFPIWSLKHRHYALSPSGLCFWQLSRPSVWNQQNLSVSLKNICFAIQKPWFSRLFVFSLWKFQRLLRNSRQEFDSFVSESGLTMPTASPICNKLKMVQFSQRINVSVYLYGCMQKIYA